MSCLWQKFHWMTTTKKKYGINKVLVPRHRNSIINDDFQWICDFYLWYILHLQFAHHFNHSESNKFRIGSKRKIIRKWNEKQKVEKAKLKNKLSQKISFSNQKIIFWSYWIEVICIVRAFQYSLVTWLFNINISY